MSPSFSGLNVESKELPDVKLGFFGLRLSPEGKFFIFPNEIQVYSKHACSGG